MKNVIILLSLILAFKTSVCQQQRATGKVAVAISDSVKIVNLNRDVTAMMKATIANDFAVLAKYTHPLVVQMMGGADRMTAYLTNEFKKMQEQGVAFSDAQAVLPEKVIAVGTELYCVVPQKVVMAYGSKRITNTSSLLAVSNNGGSTWRFVDAGGMTDEQIKQYFPKIYGKLTIPKRSEAKELTQ